MRFQYRSRRFLTRRNVYRRITANQLRIPDYAARVARRKSVFYGEAKPRNTKPVQWTGSVSRQAGKIRTVASPIFPENLNRCKPFLATAKPCPNRLCPSGGFL